MAGNRGYQELLGSCRILIGFEQDFHWKLGHPRTSQDFLGLSRNCFEFHKIFLFSQEASHSSRHGAGVGRLVLGDDHIVECLDLSYFQVQFQEGVMLELRRSHLKASPFLGISCLHKSPQPRRRRGQGTLMTTGHSQEVVGIPSKSQEFPGSRNFIMKSYENHCRNPQEFLIPPMEQVGVVIGAME